MKKYAEGGELPQDLTDRLAREKNKEDRELIMAPARAGVKAGKAVAEKLKKDMTGGAFTGARLNMPSNTRLGKLSAADTRLLNREDERKKNPYKGKKRTPYKAGGSVSSASKRADGCATKGKTKGRMV
jgi:predicted phosphoribosyltransferase